MRMSASLNAVKDKVANILENHPETRDSDKLLWLAYLSINHGLKSALGSEPYKVFKEIILSDSVPTFESITRVRRKFQESGLYQGKNRDYRLQESEAVKDWSRKQT